VSFSFEWNPGAEDALKRQVVRNLLPRFQAAMRDVTCPDHGEHPRVESRGTEWRIHRCCPKAEALAREAISKVLA
jgi:hypothetical protein